MRALVATVSSDSAKPRLQYEQSYPTPTLNEGAGDELLVQVRASAIQPSDVLNVQGNFPHTTFPRVPGRDFAGVVVEPQSHPLFGKEVYGTSGPDLSFTADGAHAEYVVVRADAVAVKPRNISFVQAASTGVPFTAAFLALHRARAEPGETVMVLGATGAVGSAAAQLAKQRGCRVLTVSRRDTSDINLTSDPNLAKAKELTSGGNGPDVVVDTIGDLRLMQAALAALAVGGRLTVISTARGGASTEMPVDIKTLYRRELSIVGCNTVERPVDEMAAWLAEMTPWFESGGLKAADEKGITKVKIGDAAAAYEKLQTKEGAGKKYVIVFQDE